MKAKKIVALLLTLVLSCSMVVSALALELSPAAGGANLPNDPVLISLVQDNIDAYAEQYLLHSVTVTDKSISSVGSDGFDVDFNVELGAELKYDSAAQLPHVQSMMACLGIDSSKLTSAELVASLDELTASTALMEIANEDMSVATTNSAENQSTAFAKDNLNLVADIAANEITSFVTELDNLYIGQTNPINLYFRATFTSEGTPASVAAVAYDGSAYDVRSVRPATDTEMRDNGATQLQNIVDSALIRVQNQTEYVAEAVAATTYRRVTARDYANSWTSNVTSGDRDTSKWRIAANPNATAPLYPANDNDCANYVSQAIFAGGIPPTTTEVSDKYHWFASQYGCSAAWESCTNMQFYFTNAKYWTNSNFTDCNAGGIIFLLDSAGTRYHVVMCVLNDTATRAYSAHTTDRKQQTYTGLSSFGTKCKSLEYYVFTNSSQD